MNLLPQFLDCSDPVESEKLLERLIQEQAAPIVERVVCSKIRLAIAEDVRSEVIADLISRLRELKESGETIRDFRAYAAVAAYHGCDKYYRRAFPQRHRLENQLRYLLGKHVRLAIWVAPDGEWICGSKTRIKGLPRLEPLAKPESWASSREASRLVERILDEASTPIAFNELVERVAAHWRISDKPEFRGPELAHQAPSVETKLTQRAWLKRVWSEIGGLPRAQRISLLLNLRDERGEAALTLLPATGVATLAQIAAAVEMSVEELTRVWKGLPLDDLRIAARLGLNRQRVIDLRRSARQRLHKLI
ncbi:MAG TPA: hypothetical protein VK752_10200 [Bryobacteraceae bacterium]|jgi:hypothetical protein|nr:hypothetical protein [Bryobacteraceae bacterium]